MTATSPTLTRAWFNRTVATAQDARQTLDEKGLIVEGPIEFVDADAVKVILTFHGGSVTIETPDEDTALRSWVLPVGWLDA